MKPRQPQIRFSTGCGLCSKSLFVIVIRLWAQVLFFKRFPLHSAPWFKIRLACRLRDSQLFLFFRLFFFFGKLPFNVSRDSSQTLMLRGRGVFWGQHPVQTHLIKQSLGSLGLQLHSVCFSVWPQFAFIIVPVTLWHDRCCRWRLKIIVWNVDEEKDKVRVMFDISRDRQFLILRLMLRHLLVPVPWM